MEPGTPTSITNTLSVLGLKGVSAKIIVLEEASRLDQNVFFEVVVPLLGKLNLRFVPFTG